MFKRIGPKALEAAKFDPARGLQNYGLTRQWCAQALEKGLTEDQTERLILGVVESVAERQIERGSPAGHLGYFSRAIEDAIAKGDVPEAPKTADGRRAEREWEEAMQDYTSRLACGETGLTRPELADFLAKAAA